MMNAVHDYGHVVVLAGGSSSERDVSLQGGKAVFLALQQLGVSAELIEMKESIQLPEKVSRVFIMVHGKDGEDGCIQGYLEMLNIPFTGSGVQASAVCMHKYISKIIWEKQGFSTPEYILVKASQENLDQSSFQYPVIVKPCTEGSSIGMTIVKTSKELQSALDLAFKYDDEVLVERWISGTELTVSIVGDVVFPVIAVETGHDFYDYSAKYKASDTRYLCPDYTEEEIKYIQSYSKKAFEALGAKGWGRVDLIRDESGNLCLLEVNTVPGMTDHSLVPKTAERIGVDYKELVRMILETSLEQ